MTAADALRANIHARLDALQISISEAERRADIGKAVLSKFLADPDKAMALDVAERLAPALGTTLTALLGSAPAHAAALRQIHPDQLVRSPLNPRKATALDAASIADLARSIAEKGVLQNLIARPHPAHASEAASAVRHAETFEIVAGERRWRAACHGIEKGLLAPDFTLPVAVRELTDDALVEIALVENIDRADMSPLETADAIAFLHAGARERGEDKAFTKRLAEATGRSDRWVRQQVQLARDLTPAAREKLAEGKISLEMAKELSQVPAAAQTHALEKIAKGDARYRTAEAVQEALLQDLPPEADAIFAMADYDGGILTRDKVRYLADPKQAERLQKAAIKARIATLQATRAFVEETTSYYWETDYPEAPKSLKGKSGETMAPWGVVVVRHGFAVKFHDRRLKRPERQTPNGHEVDTQAELVTRREDARAGVRRKLAEQLALLFEARPVDAVRAIVLDGIDRDGSLLHAALEFDDGETPVVLKLLGVEIPPGPDGIEVTDAERAAWEKEALARIVAGLKRADERTLMYCLAALAQVARDRWSCERPLTPTDVAMLTLLDLEVPPPLQHELDGGDILDLASPPPAEPDDEGGGEDPAPECAVCGVTTEEDGSCSACGPREGDAEPEEDGEDGDAGEAFA